MPLFHYHDGKQERCEELDVLFVRLQRLGGMWWIFRAADPAQAIWTAWLTQKAFDIDDYLEEFSFDSTLPPGQQHKGGRVRGLTWRELNGLMVSFIRFVNAIFYPDTVAKKENQPCPDSATSTATARDPRTPKGS